VRKAQVIVIGRHAATLAVLGNKSATVTVYQGYRLWPESGPSSFFP
jgi:hypothetical protein